MSGRILIVDGVSTNRIVLRVKMLAARYDVDAVATCAEAFGVIARAAPDLILINLTDLVSDGYAFCRALRENPVLANIAIVSVGVLDTSAARFLALDAGADDVLPRPISDALLLARVRSLMRRRNMSRELQMRDGTNRNFGFEDTRPRRITPDRITLLSDDPVSARRLITGIEADLHASTRIVASDSALIDAVDMPKTDMFIIDAHAADITDGQLFRLVADLRARETTRLASQMILLPRDKSDVAAMLLDLGSDDVVIGEVGPAELVLRTRSLLRHKHDQDRLRDTLRHGLHAAMTDALTGLYNRRYAETHLRRMAEQAHAVGGRYALMMIDIDHFKRINDGYGHAAGDRVLCELADRLKQNFRPEDLVARIGGEEFLIAMPRTTLPEAKAAAQRLRRLVNIRPFALGSGHGDMHVTVSVGVAVDAIDPDQITTLGDMFKHADAALYHAKANGRDGIAFSQSAA
ncbi:response regulator receiver modulated diguanylate cyclase [Loktanella fryxellensis]|uniref:diguanylate cyclase n=1 Tax=Loktanella fryxellensis TaxID=245187 RepID=A0A1H8ERY6_9RHOB|nr:diguanylate cyclase [Loktanella fryxellensis]SEN21894.1 response regulator receiver modulated diguanylate cyclase [Loktanella fryxellensis]